MAPTAREVALNCLVAGESQRSWSHGYLRNDIRKAELNGGWGSTRCFSWTGCPSMPPSTSRWP